jgi:enoyl-CoA hydratase/carnithine racemase
MTTQPGYADRFQHVVLRREDGIIEARFHTNEGPLVWSERARQEMTDVFTAIGHDRDNHVVIITGTGERFLADIDYASTNTDRSAEWRDKVYRDAKHLIWRLLDVDVPVIAAVNGPVRIHSEVPLMSDVVLAADEALFQDGVHFTTGGIPGDGVHTYWQMVLGANRARYFLMMAEEIYANEALRLGLVGEVVPRDEVLGRAWEIARRFNERPFLTLRYTRLCLTLNIKRAMFNELEAGLALETLGRVANKDLPYPLLREGLGYQANSSR